MSSLSESSTEAANGSHPTGHAPGRRAKISIDTRVATVGRPPRPFRALFLRLRLLPPQWTTHERNLLWPLLTAPAKHHSAPCSATFLRPANQTDSDVIDAPGSASLVPIRTRRELFRSLRAPRSYTTPGTSNKRLLGSVAQTWREQPEGHHGEARGERRHPRARCCLTRPSGSVVGSARRVARGLSLAVGEANTGLSGVRALRGR